MTRTEIKAILDSRGIFLTKSLGQNFLHDQNQVERIALLADLDKSDHVLEIGPGLGPLTERLVEKVGFLRCIELDKRLIPILRERLGKWGHLELIQGDALALLKKGQVEHPPEWKLVSNLPYSVASPILVEACFSLEGPLSVTVTLQAEVARRIFAKPGSKDYGLLSVLLQVFYETVEMIKVPSACFFPEPNVASSCIHMNRRPGERLGIRSEKELKVFETVVKLAFSQRRKKTVNLLKQRWSAEVVRSAFDDCDLAPDIRAEKIALSDYLALTHRLSDKGGVDSESSA